MRMTMQALRFSARSLARTPGFALAVVVTLALGIAASTSIFAVVNGVLLRPLPFASADRLVALANTIPAAAVAGFPFSLPEYAEHRDHNRAFVGLAAYATTNLTLIHDAVPERVAAARVSTNFFELLGVAAAVGRTFATTDDTRGAECLLVLRHGYWRTRFGAAPEVIGRRIGIDDQTCLVIGVAPADFRWPATADAWLPAIIPANPPSTGLGRQTYRAVGRLADGVSHQQATDATGDLARRFYARHPGFYSGPAWQITLTPLRNQVVGDAAAMLFILLGAVGLVFAIACGNVAQLMLGRLIARERELTIRTALGASRWQLFSQLGAECALVSVVAGALGLWLAAQGIEAFLASQLIDLPRLESIAVDRIVILFAVVASVVAGLAMAVPAIVRAARFPSSAAVAHGRSGPTVATRRWQEALVTFQVALTMVLVVSATLFIESVQRLTRVPPGFGTENRVVAQLTPPISRYPDVARASTLFRDILDRVASVPGVTAAGGVSALPLSGQDPRAAFRIDGWTPEQAANATEVHYRLVGGDYFRAIGMQLVHGRWPATSDARDATPIAIVNDSFARRFWPSSVEALGHRLSLDGGGRWHAIVGVAATVKHASLDADEQIEVFVPYEQATTPLAAAMTLVVQTTIPAAAIAPTIREQVAQVDSRLPLHAVRTMEDVLASSVARPTLRMTMTSLFATMGLLLAAVGTFCVLAQFVSERAYEIAVRRALGAPALAIVALVMRRGVCILGLGLALGVVGAVGLSGSIRSQLFEVGATDPTLYLAAGVTLASVGLIACVTPTVRAMRVEPLGELRGD